MCPYWVNCEFLRIVSPGQLNKGEAKKYIKMKKIQKTTGSADSGTGLNLETQNLKITNEFTIHSCLKLIKLKKYILVRSKLNFFTFSHFYIFFCLFFI